MISVFLSRIRISARKFSYIRLISFCAKDYVTIKNAPMFRQAGIFCPTGCVVLVLKFVTKLGSRQLNSHYSSGKCFQPIKFGFWCVRARASMFWTDRRKNVPSSSSFLQEVVWKRIPLQLYKKLKTKFGRRMAI